MSQSVDISGDTILTDLVGGLEDGSALVGGERLHVVVHLPAGGVALRLHRHPQEVLVQLGQVQPRDVLVQRFPFILAQVVPEVEHVRLLGLGQPLPQRSHVHPDTAEEESVSWNTGTGKKKGCGQQIP